MPVRPATTEDAHAIAQVHVASWRQAYRHILPADFLASLSVAQRMTMWAQSIARGLPQVLVADVEGRVVGFSALGPSRDEDAPASAFEIWAIYLAPSHWSQGLGRELWLASRDALLEHGVRSVSLWVMANNDRAIGFYTKAGFEPEPESLKTFEIAGAQVQEVRYRQRLHD